MLTTAEHLKRLPFKGYRAQYPFQNVWNFTPENAANDPFALYGTIFGTVTAGTYELPPTGGLKLLGVSGSYNYTYLSPTLYNHTYPWGVYGTNYNYYECMEIVFTGNLHPQIVLYFEVHRYCIFSENQLSLILLPGKNHIAVQHGQVWINGIEYIHPNNDKYVAGPANYMYFASFSDGTDFLLDSFGVFNHGRPGFSYGTVLGADMNPWRTDPAYDLTGGYRYPVGTPTIPIPPNYLLELTP